MKLQDLKHAADQIEITDTMQQEIIRQVSEATEGKQIHYQIFRFPRIAATVGGVLLLVVVIAIPARAFVSSLVRERMDNLPTGERQEMVVMMDSQPVEADSYSRDYTAEEKSRMSELYKQYQQGVFPEEELPQADNVEAAKALELCYLTTTSSFYLPDRELTDEELLQIIDFETKRNYVLRQRYKEEYADEIAEKKKEQEEQIEQVVNEGGITQQEAVAKAQKWLNKIFGITGEGLEMNSYLCTEEYLAILGESEAYMVNWTDFPNRQYYYFYISARDGSPVEIHYSSAAVVDALAAELSKDELSEALRGLKEKAVSFLTEKMGEDTESYTENYVSCYIYSGQQTGTSIDFVFTKENKHACIVKYTWDGTFSDFYKTTDIDAYRQNRAESVQFYQELGDRNGSPIQIEELIIPMDEL